MDLQDVKMDIGSHRPLREVVYEEYYDWSHCSWNSPYGG